MTARKRNIYTKGSMYKRLIAFVKKTNRSNISIGHHFEDHVVIDQMTEGRSEWIGRIRRWGTMKDRRWMTVVEDLLDCQPLRMQERSVAGLFVFFSNLRTYSSWWSDSDLFSCLIISDNQFKIARKITERWNRDARVDELGLPIEKIVTRKVRM